jgi:hypothetical protein
MMNVREIVMDWLKEHGFDGLFNSDGECGCKRDDLCHCDEPSIYCKAGYLHPCGCDRSNKVLEPGRRRNVYKKGCDWHIGPNKESTIDAACSDFLEHGDRG